jgi:small subunit ribosomal protein S1
LDLGLEGLLHVSEMIGTPELQPSDIVHPGETMPVKIIRIESQRKRLALSAKQVRKNEWERWVAEQQATRETHEAAAEEEEEVAAPQPEAVISEAAREEEQVAPSEPEVAISEVAEEEKGAVLEAEAAIDEATEENAAPEPEAYAEEVTVYESSPQMEAPLTPGEEATEPTTPPASGVISEVETAY